MEASFRKASDVVATLLSRRSGGGGEPFESPREPELPREWPEQLPFRKRPKPYSRAITWTPGDGGARPDRRRPYELFVSQSVLRQVRGHLVTARSGEPYGFLLGQVVYCPWSETPYIVIDALRRESQNLPPANDMDRFRHAWVAATRDARHRRGEVIGWYHRHGVLGLRMSEWDLHLQEEFFPEAWHCALIVASSAKGIIGGFIQRSPRARLFRKGLAPFHELIDIDAKLVEGRKPSLVDWENYAASEPVSVLKAKWPGPQTRLERWKARDHTSEGEPPTARDRASPTPPATGSTAGSRGLRGRAWRKAPPSKTDGGRRAAGEGEDFSEEEFTGAVGPAGRRDTPADGERASDRAEAVEAAPEPASAAEAPEAAGGDDDDPGSEAARAAPKKRKGARRGKQRTTRKASGDGETVEDETPAEPEREAGAASVAGAAPADGGWYSADFVDAVWGELPFGLEASEPSVAAEEPPASSRSAAPRGSARAADAVDSDSAADDEGAAPPRTRRSGGEAPRFELVAPFGTEPAEETDGDAGSLAWLISMIGASFARDRARPETGGEGTATETAESETAEAADPGEARAAAGEPVAADGSETSDPTSHAMDGPAGGKEAAGDARREPTRTRPPLATPAAKRRRTFVFDSQNPDDDPEAEIPVVLFRDKQPWRPSPTLLRIAATIAVLVLGGLTARAILNRGPAPAPPPPATEPPALTDGARPTPEFVDLADAYLSGLQAYRARLVQHQLGQADCERLTADFSVVMLSHRALVRYVAATPAMAERFASLHAEIGPARQRFAASGCPLPPELEPDPALDDPNPQEPPPAS